MASDVEKGGEGVSTPTSTHMDITHASRNPTQEEANFDNDTHSISPESATLPPGIEGKDQKEPIQSDYPASDQDIAIIVPRSKRRGLFGQLTLLAEVENPKTYTRRKKWFITFIVAVAGAVAPMGSSIFFRKSSVSPHGESMLTVRV